VKSDSSRDRIRCAPRLAGGRFELLTELVHPRQMAFAAVDERRSAATQSTAAGVSPASAR